MPVHRQHLLVKVAFMPLAMWALLNPHPYVPLNLVLIAMPLAAIAIAHLSGGKLQIFTDADGMRSGLSLVLMFPPVALAVRVFFDALQVNPKFFAVPAIVLGVVLTLLARAADSRMKANPAVCIFPLLFLTIYSYCALVQLNWMLDSSTRTFTAQPWSPSASTITRAPRTTSRSTRGRA